MKRFAKTSPETSSATPNRHRGHRYIAAAAALVLAASGVAVWHHQAAAPSRTAGNLQGGRIHNGIMTTVFWVGESAGDENANISNVQSAWDEHWQDHFGGYDDPDHRNGYSPAGFTPHENPFYFALPYNDFAGGGVHKATADGCLPYTTNTDDQYSWCKNIWIAVSYGGKTAYAQWEDVGPNGENDSAYVFGSQKPKNTFGAHAGLDVSPAVRDYLGLDGDNRTSWQFVLADQVLDGPWKTTVTASRGDTLF